MQECLTVSYVQNVPDNLGILHSTSFEGFIW